MEWVELETCADLENALTAAEHWPVVIFKHSTICSLSSMSLDRLERSWNESEMAGIPIYFLNVIANRNLSDQIQEVLNVRHESPQILLVHHGHCIYDASHLAISYQELRDEINALSAV